MVAYEPMEGRHTFVHTTGQWGGKRSGELDAWKGAIGVMFHVESKTSRPALLTIVMDGCN